MVQLYSCCFLLEGERNWDKPSWQAPATKTDLLWVWGLWSQGRAGRPQNYLNKFLLWCWAELPCGTICRNSVSYSCPASLPLNISKRGEEDTLEVCRTTSSWSLSHYINGKPRLMETMWCTWASRIHVEWLKANPVAKIFWNNSACRLQNVPLCHVPGEDSPPVLCFIGFIF